jgi:hypothetical protein
MAVVALSAAAATGAWAVLTVGERPAQIVESREVTVQAQEGTLEESYRVGITVERQAAAKLWVAGEGGILTAVEASAGENRSGDVIVRVDEQPVRVVSGAVPAYRTM